METIRIPARDEIDAAYQWNVAKIYADEAAWQADLERLQQALPEAASYSGHLGDGVETMLACLHWQEEYGMLLERLYLYASLRHDEDQGDSRWQALYDRIEGLAAQFSQAVAYFSPEVLALPAQQLDDYLRQPQMQLYGRMFAEIRRQQPHTLSPAEEKLLAGSGEMAGAFANIYGMLTNADMEFPLLTNEQGQPEQLSAGNYIRFLQSRNRELRRLAFCAKHEVYARYGNTIATNLAASVKKDNFYAEAQRYASALDAALFSDNMPEQVYRGMIAAVRAHLGDLAQYLAQRRRILGLDELHMYDIYVPLFPELKQKFDWQQAKRIALDALQPLGSDYLSVLGNGLEQGWVDVYENRGKASGAYSSGVYGTDPYILLNFQNDLNGVFTLVHEAGHSMHSYYSRHSQPYVYADYRIFVAEVASTLNENLLIDYLLSRAESKDEMRYLTNHFLEEFRATVFRQTMFAEFELQMHEAAQAGRPLTADTLCEMYYQLNCDYFGSEVKVDEQIAWEWARIPHFYRPYYVYKYATGFCAASVLALGLLDPDPQAAAAAREGYLHFLAAGCSKDPLDLLVDAGVDLRQPQAMDKAFALFASLAKTLS